MSILNKSLIAAADDKSIKIVDVPEWGGKIGIRVISGTERDSFESAYAENNTKNFRIRFLLKALCDEGGVRIFADSDEEVLGAKSAPVISRLFDQAWEHNAFTAEAVEAAGKD